MGHSKKRLDLTGQRFGRLTALAPAGNLGVYTAWLCRCECGREAVVATRRLRSGNTRSCGCLKPGGIPQPTYIDGTSPEMLAAARVPGRTIPAAYPGWTGWRPRGCGGPPSASRVSGATWAATAGLRTRSRPVGGRRRSCSSRY